MRTASPEYGVSSMISPLRRVLLKHARDAYRDHETIATDWQPLGYHAAPILDRAIDEYDAFVAVLKREVPAIDFLPASSETTLDSIYTYDPVIVIRAGAILCRMGKEERKSEPVVTGAHLETIGVPIVGQIEPPGTLEAGDLVWLDAQTLAVGRGYRTNGDGIRQLRKILNNSVTEIIEVPLPHWKGPAACLHLMSLLSLIDVDLAVTYSPLLPVFMRQWLIERGYTLLEIPDSEHRTLACNVLALGPRRCMLVSGNPITRGLLQEAGATVFEYEGSEISLKGTGGPTCLTRPLLRQ
jgi:N-dimethylarginine dimethylaminohydrolase